MTEIKIEHPLPAGLERVAATLYWEAFGRKLGWALGPDERAIEFLSANLDNDRAVCAMLDGDLVGVAGFKHQGRAMTGGGLSDILSTYGWIRGLPRAAFLAVLERNPLADTMVMDGIAVDSRYRGLGAGARLLDETVSIASGFGYRFVRLDVVDTNPRAKALYERNGFLAAETERTPYLRKLMGFSASTTMVRPTRGGAP